MKKISLFFLFFSLIITSAQAQCPCMKKKISSRTVDLNHILNEINTQAVNLDQQANAVFATQAFERRQVTAPPNRPPAKLVAQKIEKKEEPPKPKPPAKEVSQEKKASKATTQSKAKTRKAHVKTAKKRKSKRLKSRKSKKKYKGNCPKF